MGEVTQQQLDRALSALFPFVQEWGLPLNPEHLYEIAFAVLTHSESDASFEEIDAAVRVQLAEFEQRTERRYRD